MDAPPIQYARTEDGVDLACWTLGERSNPAGVIGPWSIGHLTAEWAMEWFRAWCERLARRFFLVAYDARVCDRAEPGQVLVPSVVRDLCRGKTFTFDDHGEATLKGFPKPVRLFVVGWSTKEQTR